MADSFDISAVNYDETFTFSLIGKAQRERVYHYLDKHLSDHPLKVLELNCGTGEDAHYISKKGHYITATDISSGMLETAKTKHPNIDFRRLDITKLSSETFEHSFDLIFSNFGGLNCLTPEQLQLVVNISAELLAPKGKAIWVIMPKKTFWERLYFFLKGDLKKAKRRNTKKAVFANVDGVQVPTWYFNPKEVLHMSQKRFSAIDLRPIGIAIPPSYLEKFFRNKKGLLNGLTTIETWIQSKIFAKYADHYLIALQKR